MKKAVFVIAFLFTAGSVFSQDVNKLIKRKYVYHVIKTLSSDKMQGRATFTPGIERAARFIEKQYKRTGLVPMPGNDGYRQNFTLFRNKVTRVLCTINGQQVAPQNVCATAGTSFNWTQESGVEVNVLGKDMNFRKASRGYQADHKKHLVLVDESFAANFKRFADVSRKGNASIKADTGSAPVVFILGKFNDVKNFKVDCVAGDEALPAYNIVGMIPGKKLPDEYVIYSGHYDHLGILPPVKGDSIANGADDDASGTTAVITLAKYFKKLNNNARTLVFVAFTGEEIGELGSQHFATTIDPNKVVAMFNIEMIGKPSKFGPESAFITGFGRSDFGQILEANLVGFKFRFYPDPYPQQDLFYRSDNASLAKKGVPAHSISTDKIDTDTLYHSVGDELHTLDIDNMVATIRAIALSSRTIISGEDRPTRIPKLEE
jgi:Zn-dependent M28 family amino/carboxypeptidase